MRTWSFLLLLLLLAPACTQESSPGKSSPGGIDLSQAKPPPSEGAWTAAHTDQVERACGSCHAFPPPEALPRDRWESVIVSMASMPWPADLADTRPLDLDTLALAVAYYTRAAPEALPWRDPLPTGTHNLVFGVEHFTPRGLEHERIPAVAHVNFVPYTEPGQMDVLASEMRSSTLLHAIPWGPIRLRSPRPLAGQLNYPVHTELQDATGDGLDDLVVASIGGMNPSNDQKGWVTILARQADRSYRAQVVAQGLGRTADARAADLDGDGDLDVAVSAFGWRGPGQLAVYENTGVSSDGASPYRAHVLDDRDGFIHVEFIDLDGNGHLDIVTNLAQEHEEILVFLGEGGLRFRKELLYRAPHPSWGYSGLQLVDLDRDGDSDILISNGDTLDDDVLKPYHGISWLRNEGNLRFEHETIAHLYGCERAVAADLDQDGDLDVVAVSFLPQIPPSFWQEKNLDSVIWVENTGGGWQPHSIEKQACYHPTVDVADYDADGKMDIVVGNYVWMEEDGRPRFRADYITLFTGR